MAVLKDESPNCVKCDMEYGDVTSMNSGPGMRVFRRRCQCDTAKTLTMKIGVAYTQDKQTGELNEVTESQASGIRIVSDGTVMGTRVFDKYGEDVTKSMSIRGIQWQHKTGGIPTAVLTCSLAAIEASDIKAEFTDQDIREISTLADEWRQFEKVT